MSVVTSNSCRDEETFKDDNEQQGAMLNMLAEVATQTLYQGEGVSPVSRRKRPRESNGMPLKQARMLSGNQMVRTFSKFEGDELRRIFSFQCLLIPKKCCVHFESFGSETKARNLMKEHLFSHLDTLPEGEILQVPRQQIDMAYKKSVNFVKPQKRTRTVKTVEIKNIIEAIDLPTHTFTEVIIEEPSQAASTVCMALAECYEELQVSLPDTTTTPDHDYYRTQPVAALDTEQYTDVETIWVKQEDDGDKINTGITDYAVNISVDNIDHPMLSVSNEVVIKTETIENEQSNSVIPSNVKEDITITPELPILQDNTLEIEGDLTGCVDRDEHRQQKKPKGKAKFIGQSAAEKEMAVRMIENMKLKQGSSEPLECQICVPARVFTAPTTLISHYRSHAGIKPYECHLCGGVFTRQHSLNYHLLIHSNKTRFTCGDCGRKFRHPSHFKEHQRRHTGEAPFECSDCVIRFKTRNTYKRHLKTRHGKVLTQSGGIIILSEEEFRRVRTAPRSLQTRVSSDKENNRRPRPKVVNVLRRKQKKGGENDFGDNEEDDFVYKYNLSGNWSTNLIENDVEIKQEVEAEDEQSDVPQALTILQAMGGLGSSPTTVMVLSADNILYNTIAT